MLTIENRLDKLPLRSIINGQKESFELVKTQPFRPQQVTHDYYRLPAHPISRLLGIFERSILADEIIEKFIAKNGKAVVLDLGCGAGFWLVRQKEKYEGRFEGYGISAIDYREPEQRAKVFPQKRRELWGGKLAATAQIDEKHYYQGDIHDLLRRLPAGKFDVVVSYQTSLYLFDPLRVLKGIYRVLRKDGYAFLEGFYPQILDEQGKNLTWPKLEKIFKESGYDVSMGENGLLTEGGLTLRKGKKSRLILPFSYKEIIRSKTLEETFDITYVAYQV